MNVVESSWSETVTTPDFTAWPDSLDSQQPFASDSPGARLRLSARQRLVDAAQQYVLRMHELAQRAEIQLPADPVLTGDPQTQPLIMTGHQPVPFHGGLTFKYHCTEQTAIARQAIAVSVMIDTDEGDPGAFEYPQVDPDADQSQSTQLRRQKTSLCPSPGVLGFVALRGADELQQQSQAITRDLEQAAGADAAVAFREVADAWQRLARVGASAAEASLILRWSQGIGSRMLELPLSAICCFPEVQEFTAGVLSDVAAFAQSCNQGLHEFREAHGISNPANPFPDLQVESGRTELPFWVLDTAQGTRRRLFAETADGAIRLFADDTELTSDYSGDIAELPDHLLLRNLQLIPRGVLITAILRLLFADLFVHGTGGGHYDEFTTQFIRRWWDVEPPPFVVASGSRYLFGERREEIQQLQALNKDLRDLRFNPQRHFGQDVFPPDVERRLQDLAQDKESVVAALKSARTEGRSAKDLGHRIQLISDEMRSVVDDAFSSQLAALNELTAQTESAVTCRTYPWFLFPAV